MSRWISLNQLAEETGLAVRTLQYIRTQEPSVLTIRQRGKNAEYKQPDCAIALRNREAEKARREAAPTMSLDEARTRKALAEAELAELDVAKARGEFVAIADYEVALARVLDRLTARLRAMPVRLSHLGPETEAAAEAEAERIVTELSAWDEDIVDAEPGEAPAAA
jgi:phage terminase Nu1 subunit (DNA packaging protein)